MGDRKGQKSSNAKLRAKAKAMQELTVDSFDNSTPADVLKEKFINDQLKMGKTKDEAAADFKAKE